MYYRYPRALPARTQRATERCRDPQPRGQRRILGGRGNDGADSSKVSLPDDEQENTGEGTLG